MQEQQRASNTLRDIFLRQCRGAPEATAYAYVRDDLSLSESTTYAELAAEVMALAGALGAIAPAGERVLLALDSSHGLEPVRLFWACIVAGLIPVPAPAPDGRHSKVAATRLSDLAADAGAHAGVTSDAGMAMLGVSSRVRWLTGADLRAPDIPRIDALERRSADLAYLQYTSGSTTSPRGVALTHACVLAQCTAVRQVAVRPGAPSRGLSWLPWFHDYGLLHGLILPMVEGAPSYLMNPMTFLRRPLRWLEAVARFEITHSGAPDFAYASCVQALARHPAWAARLDTWQVASCGAEPVRAATVQAFCEAFAPHGFRAQSFTPAYGLAEAVLVVTVKPRDTLARVLAVDAQALEDHRAEVVAGDGVDARVIVGCGEPLPGLDLRIVDPVSRGQRRAGQVGEIWISGPTVAQGYWAMPELTADVFRATLAEPSPDGSEGPLTAYLRTGDLGFMDQGQLFVTGRLKDLIVVHGRNLYPQDVEHTAQAAHASIRANGVMAFGVERSSGEGVTLLIECGGRPDEAEVADIIHCAERAVTSTHEVEVCDVAVLRSGSLPRTSSGKPRRSAARLAWLAGDFAASVLGVRAASAGIAPRDALEAQVAEVWAMVLGQPQPHVTADFFRQGGNSLLATQLVSRLNATYGTDLPIRTVFEHPTIELLAAEIRARAAETVPPAPAVPVPVSAGDMTSALSYAQQRMWFLHELAPQSTAYHMPLAVRLRGVVDLTALQRALDRVVARHAVLRTTFMAGASGVVSRVHDGLVIRITQSDLTGAAAGAALHAHLVTLTNQPFDLQRGPLLRVDLVRTGPDEAVLLIVMHHIVGDQWSFAVLAEELAACYREAQGQGRAGLPELPFQYADHAAWHRRWFEGPRLDSQRDYWVRALAGLEPVTLDADHPRPPTSSFRGAALRVPFEASEVSALTGIGADHGASLPMVLLAAFFILLRRHTGATDLCIGMPIANRHHLSSERLIGPFVNTLAVRVDLSGVLDFAAVLRRVREVALQAYAHQDMPFEQLVRELDVSRAPGRSPVFDLLFNVVNTPVAPLQFSGLAWSRLDFDRQAVQFDLTVTVDPVHDLAISFEYATELFERASVQRLAQHYGRVLREILRGSPQPVHTWPLCDDGEQRLLAIWGRGPERDVPVPTVQQVMHALAPADPARSALTCRDETWSYATLRTRCHQIARALRARGVRRGMRVGLCVSRSPWMVAVQLAILRAGAAYVPLDPAYPVGRLRDMAQDAGLGFVVSERALLGHLAWPRAQALLIDEDAAAIAAQPDDDLAADPDGDAGPQDPAYVIYTSGSSGRPKGVVVPHGAVANVLASMAVQPGLHAGDRLLAVTSLGFDISVLELLLPLAVGACVVLADREQTIDGRALASLVDQHGVTVMQATPSTWRLMVDSGWVGSVRPMRAWVGGETLSSDLADQLLDRCAQVWNLYGPTETTVWSTCWQVTRERPDGMAIGRPIANTRVYVLDDALQACPIGVPGEICIGGRGVATGYHDRPELTAERFVADPSAPDQRLYRTGDRGRWRHDGLLEHLGRLDAQVKIRGHRIEPEEVETVLRAHARVSDAVVVAREDRPGDVRLVAYVVPTASGAPDLVDLRTFLGRSLPDVMVPSHVVLMGALPLLPNGKVDRRSLPAPTPGASRGAAVAPRTDLQRAVWRVWSDILGTDAFGVHDNFFDLGGHSMLAVSMLHRIRTELQRDCPLPALYRDPTIAGLCASFEAGESDGTLEIVPLQPLGEGPALFCICGVHLYQSLAQALAPDIPVYGIFIPSENRYTRPDAGRDADNGAKVSRRGPAVPSVEQMAAEYVRAIRQQQPGGPYCLAGFSFGGVLAYEAAQQLQRAGQTVAFLGLLDSRLPARGWSSHLRRGQALVAKLRAHGLADAPRAWRTRAAAGPRTPVHDAHHGEDAAPGVADDVEALTAIRDAVYREATRRYAPQPYDGEAILVRALNETMPDALRGWHSLVRNLRVVPAQGEHLGMLEPPLAEGLAEALRPYLRAGLIHRL